MDDAQFHLLLDFLELSWRGYRKVRKGVKKRVARHMQELGCRNMRDYLERLSLSAEARRQCELAVGVSISRFFRDRGLWEALQHELLPRLVATFADRIRVWSAGCACGEEVYSLRILWERMNLSSAGRPDLAITATELNPLYLEKAKIGVYSSGSLREVGEELRSACFVQGTRGKRFQVRPELKTGIRWLARDIFSGPPGSGFHIIFVRNNLFTYYRSERLVPVLDDILHALFPGGYLVIGSHEKLPVRSPALKPHPSLSYVFGKEA